MQLFFLPLVPLPCPALSLTDGICSSDLGGSSGGGYANLGGKGGFSSTSSAATNGDASTTAVVSSSAATASSAPPRPINAVAATPTAPTLTLVTTATLGSSVLVKRVGAQKQQVPTQSTRMQPLTPPCCLAPAQGTPYLLCQPGISPTATIPCEPGVIADDAQDGPGIQHMVLLCPPAGCLATGCGGQLLVEKDIPACGVDTSHAMAVGTTYRLPFVVYNSAGLSATAFRLITVGSPCAAGTYLCSDDQCHTVDCETVDTLASLPGQAAPTELSPVLLVLLPTSATNFTTLMDDLNAGIFSSHQTMYMQYGHPAPLSLLPCATALDLSFPLAVCAAAAVRFAAAGNGTALVDLTPLVTVQNAADGSSAARCAPLW